MTPRVWHLVRMGPGSLMTLRQSRQQVRCRSHTRAALLSSILMQREISRDASRGTSGDEFWDG